MTMQKNKWILISVFALFCLLGCGPTKQDLIDNLNANEQQIRELKSFFNSIVPEGYIVRIEFNRRKTIDLFVSYIDEEKGWIIPLFREWRINPYNYKEIPHIWDSSTETKSLELVKQRLGWTIDTFREIKAMLDNANCISIRSGEPAQIGFARRGMGKFSYLIFDKPISDELKVRFNNCYTTILYSDKVVLLWGTGAIGSMRFPDR